MARLNPDDFKYLKEEAIELERLADKCTAIGACHETTQREKLKDDIKKYVEHRRQELATLYARTKEY
jgi:hypothetical protein